MPLFLYPQYSILRTHYQGLELQDEKPAAPLSFKGRGWRRVFFYQRSFGVLQQMARNMRHYAHRL